MYLKNGLGRYLEHERNAQLGGFWDRVRDEMRDIYDDWRSRRPPGTRPPGTRPPADPGTGTGIPTEAWYAIAAVAIIALWPKR